MILFCRHAAPRSLLYTPLLTPCSASISWKISILYINLYDLSFCYSRTRFRHLTVPTLLPVFGVLKVFQVLSMKG